MWAKPMHHGYEKAPSDMAGGKQEGAREQGRGARQSRGSSRGSVAAMRSFWESQGSR